MTGYDPRRALARVTEPKPTPVPEPTAVAALLDAHGQPVFAQAKPMQTCALLLIAFTSGGLVPDDFHGLPKTAAALKAHVRPDGAVYLGAFEAPNDPGSVVLVYGDPMMSLTKARAASIWYRRQLVADHERQQVSADLGPFAAAVSSPQPTTVS